MKSLYLSAAHKSSGKTTVMLGLTRALVERGLAVRTFKKGPDYIDPAWLARASRQACYNLDFYTSSHREIKELFVSRGQGSDIALIEGNKGLYDGMDLAGADSNAALAKLLGTPVVLVIDTQGMTRGIAPLLMGYQRFDANVEIAGVILNRVGGPRHQAKLVESVEAYTDLPVLGSVPRFRSEMIEERHLGLIPAHEDRLAEQTIARLATVIRDSVDLDALVGSASKPAMAGVSRSQVQPKSGSFSGLKVGIARDEAFGFYYADDLERFAALGVELVPVDFVQDEHLPRLDGLFIGGGFPETAMDALAANRSMRESVREAVEAGLPTYAECGGLMYLARDITWNGKNAPMVGVIPGRVTMSARPHGRGYIQLKDTTQALWPGADRDRIISGHEFHYSQLEGLPDSSQFAYEVLRGTGITQGRDGFVYKNLLASYAHLRDAEQHPWIERFLAFIERIRANGSR